MALTPGTKLGTFEIVGLLGVGGIMAIAPQVGGRSDIEFFDLTGENTPRSLAKTPVSENTPRISPDGERVVYTAVESGQTNVYVSDLNENSSREAVSIVGGRIPFWSHDGKEIFFRTQDSSVMMVVDVTTEPVLRVGTPRRLFDTPNLEVWDVDETGEKFLAVLVPEKEPITSLNVIFNWFDELERLVPTGNKAGN